jgi:hypothetical protein
MLRFLRADRRSEWRMFCSVGLMDGLGDLLADGGRLLLLLLADASTFACSLGDQLQHISSLAQKATNLPSLLCS